MRAASACARSAPWPRLAPPVRWAPVRHCRQLSARVGVCPDSRRPAPWRSPVRAAVEPRARPRSTRRLAHGGHHRFGELPRGAGSAVLRTGKDSFTAGRAIVVFAGAWRAPSAGQRARSLTAVRARAGEGDARGAGDGAAAAAVGACGGGSLSGTAAGCAGGGRAGTSTMRRSGASTRRSCQGKPKPGRPSPRPPKTQAQQQRVHQQRQQQRHRQRPALGARWSVCAAGCAMAGALRTTLRTACSGERESAPCRIELASTVLRVGGLEPSEAHAVYCLVGRRHAAPLVTVAHASTGCGPDGAGREHPARDAATPTRAQLEPVALAARLGGRGQCRQELRFLRHAAFGLGAHHPCGRRRCRCSAHCRRPGRRH